MRKVKQAAKHPGGRPHGVKMPCGWCGKPLTATELRAHFTDCPKRPDPEEAQRVMSRRLGRSLKSSEMIRHLDGNPRNNALDNLHVVTRQQNKR